VLEKINRSMEYCSGTGDDLENSAWDLDASGSFIHDGFTFILNYYLDTNLPETLSKQSSDLQRDGGSCRFKQCSVVVIKEDGPRCYIC
jgi:hypothetical protein